MANLFTRLFKTNEPTVAAPAPAPTKTVHFRGAYVGAAHNRLNLDWNASLESADQEALRDLSALRGRSRDLVKNNPYAARFVELVNVNVIGPHGISLQCRVRNGADELDARINTAIQDAWTLWGESASTNGKLTWLDIQQLVIKTVAADGEVFVRMVSTKNNPFGFALQVIDADYLDLSLNQNATKATGVIRQGIEEDATGAPVAYHFWTSHPAERGRNQKRVRIPANEVIHLYRHTRPGQTRGLPWLAPAMFNLKMLGELMMAELVATRTAAAKMGFIKTAADNANPYLEDMGLLSGESFDASPGTITRLDPGDEFVGWNPDHPSTAFDAFTKVVLRGIAASLNVSYASLTHDFSTENFSAARLAGQKEDDFYRSVQQWVIRVLCKRVYAKWLASALKSGALQLPATDTSRYMDVEWKPRGFDYYDPQREITAIKEKLNLGLTSRTIEAAKQGRDVREIFADLDRENQLAREFGLSLPGMASSPTPAPPPEPTPAEPDPVDPASPEEAASMQSEEVINA